jgi:hypothetical protein
MRNERFGLHWAAFLAEPLAQNLGHLVADASSRGAIEQFVRSGAHET